MRYAAARASMSLASISWLVLPAGPGSRSNEYNGIIIKRHGWRFVSTVVAVFRKRNFASSSERGQRGPHRTLTLGRAFIVWPVHPLLSVPTEVRPRRVGRPRTRSERFLRNSLFQAGEPNYSKRC